MSCSTALLSLLLISPCGDDGGSVSDAVAAAVANPSRPAADRGSDPNRKPDQVLSFIGIEPGMAVLDLFAGGGYYTEIVSGLVGPEGHVLSQNNSAYVSYTSDALQKRLDAGRLENVEAVVTEADDLVLEPASLDATLMILTWHDLLFADETYGWPDPDEALLLDKLCSAMKPGAVLGLVDHVANPGGDSSEIAKSLHRIDPQVVRDTFSNSCFKLDAESGILANPDDDHSLVMNDPAIRGNTDRFVFRFVRQ